MAGLFSRKSKNGTDTQLPPSAVSPDERTVYEPLPPQMMAEPPEALPGVPDLYGVLGVDPRSSDDIIRYAYRKKAAKLMDARWRPGRAARRLAELNAAYEILGKPDRRADYDRQRARVYYYQQAAYQEASYQQPAYQQTYEQPYQQPAQAPLRSADSGLLDSRPVQPPPVMPHRSSKSNFRARAPRGLLEAIAIVGVVAIAIYAGYTVVGNWSKIDLGRVQDSGAAVGLPVRPRTTPAPTASVGPQVTPTPRQVLVPQVQVAATPTSAPTAAPEPTKPAASAAVQGTARISNQSPPRRTDVTVSAKLTRGGQPVPNVPVYVIVHYKTVDERFPAGDATEATNENGEANVSFNVGDATAGFLATVDVVGTVEGADPIRLQTSFVPR